jgi:hypothetical protein
MSYENVPLWLRMQAGEVREDGGQATTIVLEGADGTTWGTWTNFGPSKVESVGEAIQGALRIFSEELPTGKHKVKLVALDGTEQRQFAVLPLTVAGRSSGAAAASTEALGMQRAVALSVQNFEAMTSGLRHENERLRERNDELMDSSHALMTKLLEVEGTMSGLLRDDRREALREARMSELWGEIKPMIEVGLALAADAVGTQWEAAKRKKLAAASAGEKPKEPDHEPSPERTAAGGGGEPDHPRGEPPVSPSGSCPGEPPSPPPDCAASGEGSAGGSVPGGGSGDPRLPTADGEPPPHDTKRSRRRRSVDPSPRAQAPGKQPKRPRPRKE